VSGRLTLDKLRRAQDLLRHSIPTGDAAKILDRALTKAMKREGARGRRSGLNSRE
jgi:hypothetical protein